MAGAQAIDAAGYCRSIYPQDPEDLARPRPVAVGYVRVALWARDPLVDERLVRLLLQHLVRECDRRHWLLDEVFVDRDEMGEGRSHPGLEAALDLLGESRHAALIVAVFDRLGRGRQEVAALADRARHEGWQLIITA